MDYYGPMVQFVRSIRPAALACLVAACVFPALAQTKGRPSPAAAALAAQEAEEEANAALNAELFYELLLSEITTSGGDPGTGYNLMLDAARRSGDPQLYRRATEIALQSRSGESALAAARAWKAALPQSRDANRYLLRILVALNRIDDSAEPLRQELARASTRDKISTIQILPQLYARASDKGLAAHVVRQALRSEFNNPAVGPVAWTTVGRMDLAADDKARALQAAGNALAQDPSDDSAAMLALQLLESGVPEAEGLLSRYFNGKPAADVRMAYARVLLESQRLGDAQAQLEAVTHEHPDNAQAWLLQAALQLQTGHLDQADAALQHCAQLLDQAPATEQRQRALTQVYLMQSQLAEKRGDLAQAQAWLNRIDDSDDLMAVQSRRASLLARQGRLDEARALIRAMPAKSPDEERLKLQAEVQLLREAGKYQQAYELQGKLAAMAPQDNDLAYDQAMLAEKAGHPTDMERLLRIIIARQPDYHHALNALGFSLADRGVHLDEAKALIVKALEFAPQDPFITDSLGWVEFRRGNRQQALGILERAFKARPDAEIAAHLGEVLWSLGQRDRALIIWREGLRINKDNDILKSTLKRLEVQP
ncbi:MAG: tetratricopeptide repeat protein [Proteobacteria bacterium]|nr:tetratricopeptide repeat protein [Pseudomonadota bacterium]